MADMKRIGCRVETDIKTGVAVVYKLSYFVFVRDLGDKPSRTELLIYSHLILLCFIYT